MNKSAFTLAEILITLGIIGVVSALTIPTLVKRNTNTTHVEQLKKVYATLSEAAETAMQENNVSDLHDTVLGVPDGASAAVNKAAIKNFLNTYFKVAIDCDTKPVPCFADSYKGLDGSSNLDTTNMNLSYGNCVSLADGAAICIPYGGMRSRLERFGESDSPYHPEVSVWVDVNGPKGPNIMGRDFFVFNLYSDGKIGESYTLEPDKAENDFENNCQQGSYGGCFSKIIMDGWTMDY